MTLAAFDSEASVASTTAAVGHCSTTAEVPSIGARDNGAADALEKGETGATCNSAGSTSRYEASITPACTTAIAIPAAASTGTTRAATSRSR